MINLTTTAQLTMFQFVLLELSQRLKAEPASATWGVGASLIEKEFQLALELSPVVQVRHGECELPRTVRLLLDATPMGELARGELMFFDAGQDHLYAQRGFTYDPDWLVQSRRGPDTPWHRIVSEMIDWVGYHQIAAEIPWHLAQRSGMTYDAMRRLES